MYTRSMYYNYHITLDINNYKYYNFYSLSYEYKHNNNNDAHIHIYKVMNGSKCIQDSGDIDDPDEPKWSLTVAYTYTSILALLVSQPSI